MTKDFKTIFKNSNKNIKKSSTDLMEEYQRCVVDLLQHESIQSMNAFIQHRQITCLQHSITVSYMSFLVCRKLKLNTKAAARAGLLHDFFLYDWHTTKPKEGLHGFVHPRIALSNASDLFELSALEKDIILKHMWPLTLSLPKHRESYVVTFVDKYCSLIEIFNPRHRPIAMDISLFEANVKNREIK